MFNLGAESHDDLNDALVYLIQGLVQQCLELPKIHWIEAKGAENLASTLCRHRRSFSRTA
jgi:hypothetical protein